MAGIMAQVQSGYLGTYVVVYHQTRYVGAWVCLGKLGGCAYVTKPWEGIVWDFPPLSYRRNVPALCMMQLALWTWNATGLYPTATRQSANSNSKQIHRVLKKHLQVLLSFLYLNLSCSFKAFVTHLPNRSWDIPLLPSERSSQHLFRLPASLSDGCWLPVFRSRSCVAMQCKEKGRQFENIT